MEGAEDITIEALEKEERDSAAFDISNVLLGSDQPVLTVSVSKGSTAASSAETSALVKSLNRSSGAPTHRLPRSSIFNHKEPSSTRVEKNRVAGDPTSQSKSGKAVRSGSWYWLMTRSNYVHEIKSQAPR